MRWVAVFDDDPAMYPVRTEFAQAHFDYLSANSARIVLAGGLRPAPGEPHGGGLWVLEVESREEAVRLVEADPYFQRGLRKGYRLFVWGKAPCYGSVSL